ncbi:hypothetical protein WMY93_001385 [Mugilogobius chulae]|uniref:Selenoprotein T n=1 Tax=Mugilogobius chulae TaxID=88201 RepID=A0AAW0QCL0_9GOBI
MAAYRGKSQKHSRNAYLRYGSGDNFWTHNPDLMGSSLGTLLLSCPCSKLLVIGMIIIGKDPFALFGMPAPGIWEWGQTNKIYACMMVFFLSNMIENQLMSTGAFEITLNDVPVWSKLESGHLPSMQQLVQILDNEMKMNVHMDTRPIIILNTLCFEGATPSMF